MKNKKHKSGEETDKKMEPEGRERAKTTGPTSAPAPSQPALFSAQEMALCSQKERRCKQGGSKQLYPPWANPYGGTG